MSSPQPQRAVIAWTIPSQDDFPATTGQLILDVCINEQHSITSEVTTHQVETGSDIADNIRPIPPDLQIEGMISNQPMQGITSYMFGITGSTQTIKRTIGGVSVSYSVFKFDSQVERVKAVFGDIIDAIQGAATFDITTTLASYADMACVSFSVPRNANLGNVLRFTASFKHIRFVETQTVQALPAKVTKQHRGAKTGKEASDAQATKARSVLKNLGVSRALGVGN